jgi:hypothetical protein
MSLAELSPAQKEEMVLSLSALLLQDSGVDMSAENLDAVIKVIFFKVSDQGCGSTWYSQHVSMVCIARERLRFLSLRGARGAPPSLSDGAVSRPTYAYYLPDSVCMLYIREGREGLQFSVQHPHTQSRFYRARLLGIRLLLTTRHCTPP